MAFQTSIEPLTECFKTLFRALIQTSHNLKEHLESLEQFLHLNIVQTVRFK